MNTHGLPLLIVQMGPAPDPIKNAFGQQADWFVKALGEQPFPLVAVSPDRGEPLPAAAEIRGAIISGSWSMVTEREEWSERTGRWARGLIEQNKPLLGVCYGHQLMADVMGGKVGYHPQGREMGTFSIEQNEAGRADALLGKLPASFKAHLSHMQTVLEAPASAQVLARSAHDAHQVLRYGSRVVSVQFHPELEPGLLNAYIDLREETLQKEGADPAQMRARIEPTPWARELMLQFVKNTENQ